MFVCTYNYLFKKYDTFNMINYISLERYDKKTFFISWKLAKYVYLQLPVVYFPLF